MNIFIAFHQIQFLYNRIVSSRVVSVRNQIFINKDLNINENALYIFE